MVGWLVVVVVVVVAVVVVVVVVVFPFVNVTFFTLQYFCRRKRFACISTTNTDLFQVPAFRIKACCFAC